MIRELIWSPDTCGCEFKLSYDDTTPTPRQYSLKELLKACPEHTNVADNDEKYSNALDENKRRQRVLNALKELAENELTTPLINPETGVAMRVLRDGQISWSFDANRVLNITIRGITAQKRTQLQTAINNRIGAGKVVLS